MIILLMKLLLNNSNHQINLITLPEKLALKILDLLPSIILERLQQTIPFTESFLQSAIFKVISN